MTLTKTATDTYDPVTGLATGATTESFTLYGIATNFNSLTRLASQMKPDSMILAGDKQVTVDAITAEPLPGDTLTFAGSVWKVIAVDSSAPSGATLLYKCQVRK